MGRRQEKKKGKQFLKCVKRWNTSTLNLIGQISSETYTGNF